MTVWFFGLKTNVTVSPGVATTVFGLKESIELAPTMTWWSAADAEVAAAMARIAEAREKCIFKYFFFFVVLSMDVRRNRSGKIGLQGQRSCGNVEGLARTCSDHNKERRGGEMARGD